MNPYIHVRVRGVILVDDHVLLAHAKGASNTFLPGGQVEVGESLHHALVREMAEEIQCACHVSNYLGAVEHQWSEGDHCQHEINHVFVATLSGVSSIAPIASHEAHLEFFWARPSELSRHNLLPSPLIGFIQRYAEGEPGILWASTLSPRYEAPAL